MLLSEAYQANSACVRMGKSEAKRVADVRRREAPASSAASLRAKAIQARSSTSSRRLRPNTHPIKRAQSSEVSRGPHSVSRVR